MQAIWHVVALTSPLFLLAGLGYALVRWLGWPKTISDALTRFVFAVAVPALLFRLMSDFSRLPPVDPRLLVAYFGGCLVVFLAGRAIAYRLFRMDGVGQSVFAVGGIFANNLLLGVPLAKIMLGDEAMPVVSLVLVFNSLLLWTLVTVSVEWARTRHVSLAGFAETVKNVATNPVVASILVGTAWGSAGIPLPGIADRTLDLVGQAAIPLSLIALGMGLAEFDVREGWRQSTVICVVKLALQPLAVYALARALALPPLETQAVVMLASLPVGANVYLMAREFGTLAGPIAASLVLSTALAAVTTPIVLALTATA
jgi:malonate transporter